MRLLTGIALVICSLPTLGAGKAVPAGVVEFATLASPAKAGSVVFAKTGRLAAADCADGKLRLWAMPDGRMQREIDLAGRNVDVLVMSEDGSRIAVGDHGGGNTVWDTSTGAVLAQFQMPFYASALGFSHNDKTLAIAPTGDPVQLLDVGSGRKLQELHQPVGGTAALAFSRDDRRIATGDADTVVRIYDVKSGVLLTQNAEFRLEPLALDFSADGRQLMAGGADNVIVALDTKTGNVTRKSAKTVDPVAYLEVSADGRLFAAALMHAADLTRPAPVLIFETASGRAVQEWTPKERVRGGTWTSDGRLLVATASGTLLHVWRLH
jgi:WD40 repeat protein